MTNVVMKRQETKCDMLPKKRASITTATSSHPVTTSVHGTDGQSIIAKAPVAVTAASSLLAVHWRHRSAADRILTIIANRPSLACNRH
jgi:hypothetical protein